MKPRGLISRNDILSCLLIAVAVTAAFSPTLLNGFTNFDDNAYLTANPLVRSLAPANLRRIFTTTRPHTVFSPLVTLSFALEYQCWGLRPAGYHAVNLLLHVLNALLVFFLVRGLVAAPRAALLASLLFALHPLRVESVAWISERKDLLFSFFFLLALLAYVRYLKRSSGRDYLLALFLFVLAVLSKMSALILPAVLLLMDWKVEGRVSGRRWREKIPFAAVLLLYGVSGWSSVQAFSVRFPADHVSVMASNSRWLIPFYLQKTLWPFRLSAHYPTDMRFFMPPHWLSLLLTLAVVGATFWLLGKYRREWAWGWGFFLLALLQVFVLVWHFFPVANRYSYLPAVGLSFVLALAFSAAGDALNPRVGARRAWRVLAVLVLAALGASSFSRCRVWRDSLSLWDDVIAKYPVIPLAYVNRAAALKAAGRLDEALTDYSRAIRLLPDGETHWNRGLAWKAKGQEERAEADFYTAVRLDPSLFRNYSRMALGLHGRAGADRVIAMGRRVLAVRPDARIHLQLAGTLIRLGRWAEAERHLEEAARLAPREEEYRRALRELRAAMAGQAPRDGTP